MEALNKIQCELNAPKNQRNNFGNYNYRSCEDICEALKPLLAKYKCTVTINDDIVVLGDRFYVKATATISDGTESISATAFARESLEKKGMDASQVTGATSSYARKYALNGLFLIDDNKDADALNVSKEYTAEVVKDKKTITKVAKAVSGNEPKDSVLNYLASNAKAMDYFCKTYGRKTIDAFTPDEYNEIYKFLIDKKYITL